MKIIFEETFFLDSYDTSQSYGGEIELNVGLRARIPLDGYRTTLSKLDFTFLGRSGTKELSDLLNHGEYKITIEKA